MGDKNERETLKRKFASFGVNTQFQWIRQIRWEYLLLLFLISENDCTRKSAHTQTQFIFFAENRKWNSRSICARGKRPLFIERYQFIFHKLNFFVRSAPSLDSIKKIPFRFELCKGQGYSPLWWRNKIECKRARHVESCWKTEWNMYFAEMYTLFFGRVAFKLNVRTVCATSGVRQSHAMRLTCEPVRSVQWDATGGVNAGVLHES